MGSFFPNLPVFVFNILVNDYKSNAHSNTRVFSYSSPESVIPFIFGYGCLIVALCRQKITKMRLVLAILGTVRSRGWGRVGIGW